MPARRNPTDKFDLAGPNWPNSADARELGYARTSLREIALRDAVIP